MTREEAEERLKAILDEATSDEDAVCYVTPYDADALEMAIKALESKDVLDKIRAEIDGQYDRVHPYNISCAEGLEMALEIIDKYKAESEDKT